MRPMLKEKIMGQRCLLSMYIRDTVRLWIRVHGSSGEGVGAGLLSESLRGGQTAALIAGGGGCNRCCQWLDFYGQNHITALDFLIRILAAYFGLQACLGIALVTDILKSPHTNRFFLTGLY